MTQELTSFAETNSITANNIYFDHALFEHTQRVATLFAKSSVVPQHYQNNVSNCFIAVATATRMRIDPFLYMQKSFVLNGKPGTEAQILIAALNQSGLIKGRIQYAYSGEGEQRTCTAFVEDAATGMRHEYILTLKDALQVGNANRNPNWKAIPDLMLSYRSATYLIRTYYPEAGMGLLTKDEAEDIEGIKDITPKRAPISKIISTTVDELNAKFLQEEEEVIPEIIPTSFKEESAAITLE